MDLITAQLLLNKYNIYIPVSCLTESCLSKANQAITPDFSTLATVLANELKWGLLIPQAYPRLHAQHVYYFKNLLEKKDYKALLILLFTTPGIGPKKSCKNKPMEQGFVGGETMNILPPYYPYQSNLEYLIVKKIIPTNNQTKINECVQKGLLSAKLNVRYNDTNVILFKLATNVFMTGNFDKITKALKPRETLAEELNTVAYILNSPHVSVLKQECVNALVPINNFSLCCVTANSVANRTEMVKLEAGLELLLAMFLNILQTIYKPAEQEKELQKMAYEIIDDDDDDDEEKEEKIQSGSSSKERGGGRDQNQEDDDDDDDVIIQEMLDIKSFKQRPPTPAQPSPRTSQPLTPTNAPVNVSAPKPKTVTPKAASQPMVYEPPIVPQTAQLLYVPESNSVIQEAYAKLNIPLQTAITALLALYPELAVLKKPIKFHQSTVDYYQNQLDQLKADIDYELPGPSGSHMMAASTAAAPFMFNTTASPQPSTSINEPVVKITKKKKKTYKTPAIITGEEDSSEDELICVSDITPNIQPKKKVLDSLNFVQLKAKSNVKLCLHTARLVKAANNYLR
ncbi:protein ORF91 [Lake sturgeon herpesvirus]|nr:protein ORF91 [Lake sturgeon herpesvirus]